LGEAPYLYFGNFVELGPKLNDAIQVLTWQNEGTGRLQLRSLSSNKTFEPIANRLTIPARDRAYRYHDNVAGEDCDAIWTPEGKVRCVPVSVPKLTNDDTFLDPDCTKPYYGNYGFAGGEAMVVESLQFGEQRAVSLHNFVSVPASTVLYYRIADICAHGSDPIESYPEPGPEISWDAYPILDEVNVGPLGAAPDHTPALLLDSR
jgi:hypothetical protein